MTSALKRARKRAREIRVPRSVHSGFHIAVTDEGQQKPPTNLVPVFGPKHVTKRSKRTIEETKQEHEEDMRKKSKKEILPKQEAKKEFTKKEVKQETKKEVEQEAKTEVKQETKKEVKQETKKQLEQENETKGLFTDVKLAYVGNSEHVQKIRYFLQQNPRDKLLWLRGPPGIGKTVAVKTAAHGLRPVVIFNAVDLFQSHVVDLVLTALTCKKIGQTSLPVVLIQGVDSWHSMGPNAALQPLLKFMTNKKQRKYHGPLVFTDNNHYRRQGSEKFKAVAQIIYMNPLSIPQMQHLVATLQKRIQSPIPPPPIANYYTGDTRQYLLQWQIALPRRNEEKVATDYFPFMQRLMKKKVNPWKENVHLDQMVDGCFHNYPKTLNTISDLPPSYSDIDCLSRPDDFEFPNYSRILAMGEFQQHIAKLSHSRPEFPKHLSQRTEANALAATLRKRQPMVRIMDAVEQIWLMKSFPARNFHGGIDRDFIKLCQKLKLKYAENMGKKTCSSRRKKRDPL